MVSFTTAHFPSEHNSDYPHAGKRTCWAGMNRTYSVLKDTTLYPSGTSLTTGTEIRIVLPPKLYSHQEVGASRGTFTQIEADAGPQFLCISHIEKPKNITSRMSLGEHAQKRVAEHIVISAKDKDLDFELVSMAKIGSTVPDLVFSCNEEEYQFEIKSTASWSAPITMFDKCVHRHSVPALYDTIAENFVTKIEGIEASDSPFLSVIDWARENIDPDVSLAADPWGPKSGKLPNLFSTTDPELCEQGRDVIIDHLHESRDNYFSVYNRAKDDIMIYHTGFGDNPLDLPGFPEVKKFSLSTYGGQTFSGATRVGLRICI